MEGINLLLFTFPVMFVAVFGCIYLHLQKKSEKTNLSLRHVTLHIPRSYRFDEMLWLTGSMCCRDGKYAQTSGLWRRPVMVMAPLGIVSMIELAFGAMFIALLIWSLANYLYVSFGHLHMHKVGEKV